MKISTGRLLLLFSSLFLFNCVSALSACQCSTVNTGLHFTNNESIVQHYSLQKGGLVSTWATLTPTTFSLNPGESQLVVAFIRVDCDVAEGVYDLTVKAVSEDDLITEVINLTVSSCHSISVSSSSDLHESCVNEELVIPLTVSNNGNYVEDVNLSSSTGSLSTSSLSLDSGDSQIVNLVLTPGVIGTNSVTINALFNSGSSSASVSINSIECSAFTASLSQGYVNLCEDEEARVNLTVTNDGNGKQFYFNASSIFTDLPSSTYLGPHEVFSSEITVFSGCDNGVFNPLISVWADGAGIVELPLVLNIRGCFLPVIVIERVSDVACACEVVSYSFDLYNPGTSSIIYALSSSGTIGFSSVELAPDGSTTLVVNQSIPCDFVGDLSVSLMATSISTCSKTATGSVALSVDSWSDCQAVNVDGPLVISGYNDSPFTVPISVSNIGVRPTSYNVVVSGSAMNNLLGVSRSFVTLEPGESEVLELTFDPSSITGSFISVQAFSTDNLASDSTVISFGEFFLSDFDLYFLLIPSAVAVLLAVLLVRSNVFKKRGNTKPNGKKDLKK